ncbi:COMM domain-containing protein 2 [Leptopilina boulardi]|uniref:COMM domain-containing protein 2 n=1 Tax=Leptopilina boulardi TaxID=63433 RepID=UPI0021F5570D|nr:COMM domain-containing protein 2 [Leptopilina boulardi]
MLLILKAEHKRHLLFLTQQNVKVLQDFCKLALDYLQNGLNLKYYNSAAQKLSVDPEIIKNSVHGLVHFLLESCRYKLNVNDFQDSVIAVGFTEEQEALLSKLYALKKADIAKALAVINFKSPQYQDMEWRFEAQIASRSSLNQALPLVTCDLFLKSSESSKEIEHVFIQLDPLNLVHLVHELEDAMQEGHSQHIKSITRSIK